MKDQYFTPSVLADSLVGAYGGGKPGTIGDFAAGDGELLKAAERRWPDARFIATDIDEVVVKHLVENKGHWDVGCADLLDSQSVARCGSLASMIGKVDLVLLNPPFSGRGGTRFPSSFDGLELRSSRALAFLLASLCFLSVGGEVLALLPSGVLRSERDREAMRLIQRYYELTVLSWNGRTTFQGCSPQTVSVHLQAKPQACSCSAGARPSQQVILLGGSVKVGLKRGSIQMFTVGSLGAGDLPLVHSTELVGNQIKSSRYVIDICRSLVRGPAVLMPRVGRPDQAKVCLYLEEQVIAVSDCIIAVCCKNRSDAKSVWQALQDNWILLKEGYSGTCAPYITLASLGEILSILGFKVV